MAKALFRFLRGELNGFYLQNFYMSLNEITSDMRDFLSRWERMVFKSSENLTEDELSVPKDIARGLGTFAGVFLPYVEQDSRVGSVRFTLSNRVSGVEYSERGLFDLSKESFDFFRTDRKEYSTDINSLANSMLRSTLVESGAPVKGYILEGIEILRDDGTVDESKLVNYEQIPKDGEGNPSVAYVPYYGNQYLYLSEKSPIRSTVSINVFIELVKAMQWVRYNGASVASLCKFAKVLCPDYLFMFDFDWDTQYAKSVLEYGIDPDLETPNKLMRSNVFKLMANLKFPQIEFREVDIKVTRDYEGKVISVEKVTD